MIKTLTITLFSFLFTLTVKAKEITEAFDAAKITLNFTSGATKDKIIHIVKGDTIHVLVPHHAQNIYDPDDDRKYRFTVSHTPLNGWEKLKEDKKTPAIYEVKKKPEADEIAPATKELIYTLSLKKDDEEASESSNDNSPEAKMKIVEYKIILYTPSIHLVLQKPDKHGIDAKLRRPDNKVDDSVDGFDTGYIGIMNLNNDNDALAAELDRDNSDNTPDPKDNDLVGVELKLNIPRGMPMELKALTNVNLSFKESNSKVRAFKNDKKTVSFNVLKIGKTLNDESNDKHLGSLIKDGTVTLYLEGLGSADDSSSSGWGDKMDQIDLKLTPGADYKEAKSHGLLFAVDLDIDSNNNEEFIFTKGSQGEESIEDDPNKPGKIIFPNNGIADGVVCWADGFDINPNDEFDDRLYNIKFTPVILKLPENVSKIDPERLKVIFRYEDSDPSKVTYKLRPEPHEEKSSKYEYFAPSDGESRIWTKHGDEIRKKESITANGDFVPADEAITWKKLTEISGNPKEITLYIENVKGSGLRTLKLDFEIGEDEIKTVEAVNYTLLPVDIVINKTEKTEDDLVIALRSSVENGIENPKGDIELKLTGSNMPATVKWTSDDANIIFDQTNAKVSKIRVKDGVKLDKPKKVRVFAELTFSGTTTQKMVDSRITILPVEIRVNDTEKLEDDVLVVVKPSSENPKTKVEMLLPGFTPEWSVEWKPEDMDVEFKDKDEKETTMKAKKGLVLSAVKETTFDGILSLYEVDYPIKLKHVIKLLPLKIKEVNFAGAKYHELRDDKLTKFYSMPHWVDKNGDCIPNDSASGERNYSVAYTRNTKPSIGADFEIEDLPAGLSIKIRYTGSDGIKIIEKTANISGDNVILPITTSDTKWPNTIRFYDRNSSTTAFQISWEMKIEDSDWVEVAKTKHQVYLTLNDPITTLRQETLFFLSSKNADGDSAEAVARDSVFVEFTDRDVRRLDGVQMTYWKLSAMGCTDTPDLLSRADGNGNCQSWGGFFRDMLRVHGVAADRIRVFPQAGNSSVIVKNWRFNATTSGPTNHPYVDGVDAFDLPGIPAQGNLNPPGSFNGHWITRSGGYYYDPSYGTPAVKGGDVDKKYEDGAFEGYGANYVSPSTGGRIRGIRKNNVANPLTAEAVYTIDN